MPFPTTDERVRLAEEQLGVVLPSKFRDRLLTDNGGELAAEDDDWQVFPVFDPVDRKRAARTANHIVRESKQASRSHGFPTGALAVAANGTGDYLVFLADPASGRLAGRVHYWNHETGCCTPTEHDFS